MLPCSSRGRRQQGAMPSSHQAFRVQAQDAEPGHPRLDVEWKAWVYQDSFVAWELRRMVEVMQEEREGSWKLNVLLKKEWPCWNKVFMGLSFHDEHKPIPSALAWRSRRERLRLDPAQPDEDSGMVDVLQERVREEFSISTQGVLGICMAWMMGKRKRALKQKAAALLRGFLRALVLPAQWGELHLLDCAEEAKGLCDQGGPAEHCKHLQQFVQHCEPHGAVCSAEMMVECLGDLMRGWLQSCAACREILARVTLELSGMVNSQLAKVGNGDITSWRRPNRRRRHDEDWTQEICKTLVQKGMASHSLASCRAHGVRHSTAQRWASNRVAVHMEQCWRTLGQPLMGVYALCEDGTRLGNPSTETQVYAFWCGRRRCGAWLPPQRLGQPKV